MTTPLSITQTLEAHWVHSCSAFSTDLLQISRGLLKVKKLLKKISSLCQKECANLFLYQQLKVHFFLWGICVCIRVCVRVRQQTDLSPGGWLSCFQVYQLLMVKVKVTLHIYLLKKCNYWKSGKWDLFGHLGFFILWSFQHCTFERITLLLLLREKDQQLTLSFQPCLW